MSVESNLRNLATRVGNESKALRTLINNNTSDLSSLTTAAKSSLVVAINELQAEINALATSPGGATINDGTISSGSVWSSQKVSDMLNELKEEILGPDVAAALDTLKEIGDYIEQNRDSIGALTTGLANRVRFDQAQSLTAPQQLQARQNISAVSQADVGDTNTNYVTIFESALAS